MAPAVSVERPNVRGEDRAPTPRRRGRGVRAAPEREGVERERRPHTNRAVQITKPPPLGQELEFLIHEATGTARKETSEAINILREFGVILEEQEYGSRIYRRRWVGDHGIALQADNKMGSDEIHVRIPGQACEHLGLVTLLSLVTVLDLKLTRLDAAIDNCPFEPRDLFAQREAGNTRTHAQAHQFMSNGEGDTFTLGSRTSDVFLRCYNKRGFTRVELEMKRGHAQEFLAGLFSRSEEEYPALFLGALRSQVDFVNRWDDENISRCSLLPFWAKFVRMFERIKLAPSRVPATVDRYIDQAHKQMAAMFHTYVELLTGSRAFRGHSLEGIAKGLYQAGRDRLQTRHRLLLAEGWYGSALQAYG